MWYRKLYQWCRKTFRSKSKKMEDECEAVYEASIPMAYWYLLMKCKLSSDKCYAVLLESCRYLGKHVGEVYGRETYVQCVWFLQIVHKTAKHLYNISEVEGYEILEEKIL